MNAPRLLPLLALAALVACSSAPPTLAPSPAPSAAAAASASSEPGPGWTPHDPRIVRCGIDDRPRNVVSRLDEAAPLRLKRAPPDFPLLPPQPPPPPPPPPTPGVVLVDRAPAEDPPPVPPGPALRIERLPLSNPSGGAVPPLADGMDPQFDICLPLAGPTETAGPVTFGLELASSGAPLRVLPPAGDGTPTPLVRCLMERSCQLKSAAPGQKTRLDVALRVSRDEPLPTPPPAALVRVDVGTENPRSDLAELELQLRVATSSVMQACGAVPGRARVRLSLDLESSGGSSRRFPRPVIRRSRNLRIMMPPPPQTSITGQRTEVLEGTVSGAVLGCVVNGIRQRSFSQLVTGKRTEKMILTWNP